MASFFDDIGKAFSNAGQKTKNMADAAKLNSTISEEEKKLNSIYAQIGQTYIQLHFEDYEEPFAPLIQSYVESRKRIEDMTKRVKELKNITSCPGCGADISGNAAFCSKCGYRMPPKAVPQGPVMCVSCGATIAPGMNFCTTCGAPAPAPAPAQPAVAVCSSCNAQLEPGSLFCVVCGTPVSAPANAPVPSPTAIPTPAPVPMDVPAPMPAAEPTPVPTPVSMPVPEAAQMPAETPAVNICPTCGTVVTEDSMFCIECGTKVR